MPALVLDITLGLVICAVALGTVLARDLLASIVFFIVYGAMLSIAWVRLGSIDVALAEAAIGAGLTGILLIGAAARLKAPHPGPPPQGGREKEGTASQLVLFRHHVLRSKAIFRKRLWLFHGP